MGWGHPSQFTLLLTFQCHTALRGTRCPFSALVRGGQLGCGDKRANIKNVIKEAQVAPHSLPCGLRDPVQ